MFDSTIKDYNDSRPSSKENEQERRNVLEKKERRQLVCAGRGHGQRRVDQMSMQKKDHPLLPSGFAT